jgi:DNA-binding CsgD family transcriptional regulator
MSDIRDFYNLSSREWECLNLWARGMTAKTMAIELGVSHRTVESYIEKIKDKTGLFSKRDLIALIHKEKLGPENLRIKKA